jgi:hypothetical protein
MARDACGARKWQRVWGDGVLTYYGNVMVINAYACRRF